MNASEANGDATGSRRSALIAFRTDGVVVIR